MYESIRDQLDGNAIGSNEKFQLLLKGFQETSPTTEEACSQFIAELAKLGGPKYRDSAGHSFLDLILIDDDDNVDLSNVAWNNVTLLTMMTAKGVDYPTDNINKVGFSTYARLLSRDIAGVSPSWIDPKVKTILWNQYQIANNWVGLNASRKVVLYQKDSVHFSVTVCCYSPQKNKDDFILREWEARRQHCINVLDENWPDESEGAADRLVSGDVFRGSVVPSSQKHSKPPLDTDVYEQDLLSKMMGVFPGGKGAADCLVSKGVFRGSAVPSSQRHRKPPLDMDAYEENLLRKLMGVFPGFT